MRFVGQGEKPARQIGGWISGAQITEIDDADERHVVEDQIGRVRITVDPLGWRAPPGSFKCASPNAKHFDAFERGTNVVETTTKLLVERVERHAAKGVRRRLRRRVVM